MHHSKVKAMLILLLGSNELSMANFEVKANLFINGKDVITPLVTQIKKAPEAIDHFIGTLRVPCLWQLKDGKICTTYMHPVHLALAGAFCLGSVAALKVAWDAYQKSKHEQEHRNFESYQCTAMGILYAGCAIGILNDAPKTVIKNCL